MITINYYANGQCLGLNPELSRAEFDKCDYAKTGHVDCEQCPKARALMTLGMVPLGSLDSQLNIQEVKCLIRIPKTT